MADITPNLSLPYIMASQAQKHVTHNEALRALDAIVQLGVIDKDLVAPPGAPLDGDRYIVALAATGSWAGMDGQIAAFQDNAWIFHAPRDGWLAWVSDEDQLYVWSGSAWVPVSDSDLQNIPLLGVNATADPSNRLSVSSPATLLNHDGAGHQVKINKNNAIDTASLVFQTGFSGRAEFGTTGDDDWHVKVSPDGINWHEALIVDRNTGRISFPGGGVREKLEADRTYYVDTALGSDGNDGLSTGSAFATIMKGIDAAAALDSGQYDVTVQIAAGSYGENIYLKTLPGSGTLRLIGDAAAPANVFINPTGIAIRADNGGKFQIQGVRTASTSINIYAETAARLALQDIEFAGGTVCVQSSNFSDVTITGAHEISANYDTGFFTTSTGRLISSGASITLTGSPGFAQAFVFMDALGGMLADGMSFAGTATGRRYDINQNSVCNTQGGGATYFPGDVAGITGSGGQYL